MPYGASTTPHCVGLCTSAIASVPTTCTGTSSAGVSNSRHAANVGGASTSGASGIPASGAFGESLPHAPAARASAITTAVRTSPPYKTNAS